MSARHRPSLDARELAFDGALNLRDLGGLPTAHGATAFGRVVRGGRRERLTAEGWRQLAAHGIGHVIDLRTAPEVHRRPTDPQVPAAAWESFDILQLPVEDFAVADYVEALDHPYLNHPKHYPLLLAHFPAELAAVMHALARIARLPAGTRSPDSSDPAEPGSGSSRPTSPRPGVYIHCSAGRDRTGLVSAWLLQLAGVADAEIIADYRRSVDRVNEYHRTSGHPVEKHEPPAVFEPWARSRTEALAAFLRAHPAAEVLPRLGLEADEVGALASLLAPPDPRPDPSAG